MSCRPTAGLGALPCEAAKPRSSKAWESVPVNRTLPVQQLVNRRILARCGFRLRPLRAGLVLGGHRDHDHGIAPQEAQLPLAIDRREKDVRTVQPIARGLRGTLRPEGLFGARSPVRFLASGAAIRGNREQSRAGLPVANDFVPDVHFSFTQPRVPVGFLSSWRDIGSQGNLDVRSKKAFRGAVLPGPDSYLYLS